MLRDERVENTAMIKSGRRQQLKRKERGGEKYVTSRWIPVVKDIMEVSSHSHKLRKELGP